MYAAAGFDEDRFGLGSGFGARPYGGMYGRSAIGFGGYGGYGGGYGGYGQRSNTSELEVCAHADMCLQTSPAQASSRNAFSSIESIVSAFVSVAQMLESTYEAMFSSFRCAVWRRRGRLTSAAR